MANEPDPHTDDAAPSGDDAAPSGGDTPADVDEQGDESFPASDPPANY